MAATKNKPNEIYITRVYDAPVKMVWDAWVEEKQVAQWWGPRGYTITTHSKDIRTGGMWHYTMHGPDGVDYVNKTQYLEVIEGAKMIYDHGGNDEKKPMFRVTVLFKDLKGKTEMDMTMALPNAEAAENTRQFIKRAKGDSTWDRFAEYLEMAKSKKDIFVINRVFKAPIDLVFDVWTDPKHSAQWTPPTGATMKYIRADVKEGGSAFYSMTMGGNTMYGRAQYLKIEKPHRIVYLQQFCDANEKVARHPMAATWPETMRTTVLLAEEENNQTRVTVMWEIEGQSTAEERETFSKAKDGMAQGWGGSFDKLEEYLPGVIVGGKS
jgi:uncharacterized protein YndB with AHSA1/START domain